VSIAALALSAASCAESEFCGQAPAPGFDQAPNHPHTGRYVNKIYGYSVSIPDGLTAYTNAAGPERGFGVVLSWKPRAYLSVDAAYDVFYDITADGVHRRDINAMRLHATVVSDQVAPFKLAHVTGGRYLTGVQCVGDPQLYSHADVIVIRNREIYRLNLQTVPARYADDIKRLDAMLKSWRWQALN